MATMYRTSIPMAITFAIGMFFLFDYFLVIPKELKQVATDFNQWGVVIAAAAMGVGVANLLKIHGRHISKRTPGQWYNSVACLAMVFLFPLLAILGADDAFNRLYFTINQPISGTIYMSTVFYLYSAAYRAFRVTRLSALLLLALRFFRSSNECPHWRNHLGRIPSNRRMG